MELETQSELLNEAVAECGVEALGEAEGVHDPSGAGRPEVGHIDAQSH